MTMLSVIMLLSGTGFGFVIGLAVAIRMLSRQRFAASRETFFEIGNPLDLRPADETGRIWEGQ